VIVELYCYPRLFCCYALTLVMSYLRVPQFCKEYKLVLAKGGDTASGKATGDLAESNGSLLLLHTHSRFTALCPGIPGWPVPEEIFIHSHLKCVVGVCHSGFYEACGR